jgi:DNA polymerase zeta
MYVKREVRKGLLGRMLTELLETRVMVKQAMKSVKEDKASTVILMDSVDVHTLPITGPQKSP